MQVRSCACPSLLGREEFGKKVDKNVMSKCVCKKTAKTGETRGRKRDGEKRQTCNTFLQTLEPCVHVTRMTMCELRSASELCAEQCMCNKGEYVHYWYVSHRWTSALTKIFSLLHRQKKKLRFKSTKTCVSGHVIWNWQLFNMLVMCLGSARWPDGPLPSGVREQMVSARQ